MGRWVLITAVSSDEQVEGESLTDQKRRLRVACAQHGGTIIDEIEIPGMSRSFIDWHELKAEASIKGIAGFQRIEDHWKARDFDVMAAIDTTRLWRTDALTVYGMARIYQAGGKLFTIRDGFIEEANRSMFSMMAGFQTQKEIESLKQRWRTGMKGRLKRGLPAVRLPFCYKYVRDDRGAAIGVEVDMNWRFALDRAAELFLNDVSYMQLGPELYRQHGILSPAGVPFTEAKFVQLFWSPLFWGHAALSYQHVKGNARRANWVFGPSDDLPSGVEITYNAYDPIYTEPLRSEIIAEVKRRQADALGRLSKVKIHRFTGLLQCGVCGGPLSAAIYNSPKRRPAFRCHNLHCDGPGVKGFRPPHSRIKSVLVSEIQLVVERLVAMALDGEPIVVDTANNQLDTLEKERERLEARIDRLIEDKLNTSSALASRYDAKLNEVGVQLQHVKDEIASMQSRLADAERRHLAQKAATAQLRSLGEQFWALPESQINRLLHLLFGEYRLIMENGCITGIGLRINHKRKELF